MRYLSLAVAVMFVASVLVAGCAPSTPETKPVEKPKTETTPPAPAPEKEKTETPPAPEKK